ncbi:hypothetical protein [Solirhodobacter olei]|uniref:hypothetical protein n=1 Tax=Solirhodobacter olei TaxID=2493082 RepID=UPI000FDB418B|nr:hypothetical protein [Solirhodobacter olei]
MHKPVQNLEVTNTVFIDDEFGEATVVIDTPEGQRHLDIEFTMPPAPFPPFIDSVQSKDGLKGGEMLIVSHLAQINEVLMAQFAACRDTV